LNNIDDGWDANVCVRVCTCVITKKTPLKINNKTNTYLKTPLFRPIPSPDDPHLRPHHPLFSPRSTKAYPTPPKSVTPIPSAFTWVMRTSKIATPNRIVRACFTFPVGGRGRGQRFRDTWMGIGKGKLTSNSHTNSPNPPIRTETNNIKPKRQNTINTQP
jgi:hypothetical protein